MKSTFLLCCLLVASLGVVSFAAENATLSAQNTKNVVLGHAPGTPACFVGAPVHGDPRSGPSILLMSGAAGCTVPFHWHPAGENIILTAGTARAQVKGHGWTPMSVGDFISVPAKNTMRFTCVTRCSLYVYSDGPFNLHYMNDKGVEITPNAALK